MPRCLGLFVGLGALTKNTVLVVATVAFAALVAAHPEEKSPSRIVNLLVALAVAALVAGPWWARNTILYGDPLAMTVFSQAATAGTPGLAQISADWFTAFVYWRALIWLIFMTAWGFFGGVNSALSATGAFNFDGPGVREIWLLPLVAVFALAPLASLLGWRKARITFDLTPEQKSVLWFWFFGFVLVVLAWLQFAYAHRSGGQARYLHPALLPMCVLGAAGWRALWGEGRALKVASWAFGALLILMTLLNIFVWKTLV